MHPNSKSILMKSDGARSKTRTQKQKLQYEKSPKNYPSKHNGNRATRVGCRPVSVCWPLDAYFGSSGVCIWINMRTATKAANKNWKKRQTNKISARFAHTKQRNYRGCDFSLTAFHSVGDRIRRAECRVPGWAVCNRTGRSDEAHPLANMFHPASTIYPNKAHNGRLLMFRAHKLTFDRILLFIARTTIDCSIGNSNQTFILLSFF